MYKLITVKDYSKLYDISETATRKRIASKFLVSCQLEGLTYVAIEDSSLQIIKDLKSKIRLLNARIKTAKEKENANISFKDEILHLRERVISLENDLRVSNDRLHKSTDTKENLYEKVINVLRVEHKS